MASPKKSSTSSFDTTIEIGETARKRAKKKAEQKAPEPAPIPTKLAKQRTKADRIARQDEAAQRNKELRRLGKPTPWEEKREARRQARLKDPKIVQRRKRRESDAMAADRARRLAEAEAAEKAATPAIAKIHASA